MLKPCCPSVLNKSTYTTPPKKEKVPRLVFSLQHFALGLVTEILES